MPIVFVWWNCFLMTSYCSSLPTPPSKISPLCEAGSLQSGIVGVFTPRKLATSTNLFLLLSVPRRDCLQLSAYHSLGCGHKPKDGFMILHSTPGWLRESCLHSKRTFHHRKQHQLWNLWAPLWEVETSVRFPFGVQLPCSSRQGGLRDHRVPVKGFSTDTQLPWEISKPGPCSHCYPFRAGPSVSKEQLAWCPRLHPGPPAEMKLT